MNKFITLLALIFATQIVCATSITKEFVKPVSEVFVQIEDCKLIKSDYTSKISTVILKAPDVWKDSLEYAMTRINILMPYQNVVDYKAGIFPLNNRCEARCIYVNKKKEAYIIAVYSKELNVFVITALSNKAFKSNNFNE